MLRDTFDQPQNHDATTTIVKCSACGYVNRAGQTLCSKCQTVLRIGISSQTSKLPPKTDLYEVPKWGTTSIDKKLYLHVRNSGEPIELPLLESGTVLLGRYDSTTGEKPDVDLTRYGASDKGVSRRHARLSFEGTTLRVTDLNSANATYLNGYKLVPGQARILRDGDELRLGYLVLLVQFGENTIAY